MISNRLKNGDTIGVCAWSNPIIDENVEELDNAVKIMKNKGFVIELGKNIYSNSLGYSASPIEKAEDFNNMILNPNIKAVWNAKGGMNSQGMLDYIDFDAIKNNPKIIIGYSDSDTITNVVCDRTGLITFWGTNFKTIATDETDFSINDTLSRLMNGNLELGDENEYRVIQAGSCEGKIIGGNLHIMKQLTCGKYKIDFSNKILFLEAFYFESDPTSASNCLYYLKQNNIFDQIKGLWIGAYGDENNIQLDKIISDVLGNEYNFPIIQSNNFGHIERKITIPIGAMARIDTNNTKKIKLTQDVVV